MKKFIVLFLCFITNIALAQTGARTPQPNDVFTYFGPTIGGDWGPPPTGPVIPDNVTLKTYSVAQATYLTRQSFSSTVYAPPLAYIANGSPCTLNAGAGDDGSQVRSSDGKCWIAKFPEGRVDARQWGTVSDSGVTDNTAAVNACLAYAATIQVECLLPGTPGNSWIKVGALVVPPGLSATYSDGGRTGLRGHGKAKTLLHSTVTGVNCALTYSFTYGVNGEGYTGGDFQFIGTGTGYGLCLTGVTSGTFSGFFMQGFTIGLYALDTIRVHLDDPTFFNNGQHISAGIASNSRPNQWVIVNPMVSGSTNDAFIFNNASDISIYGGDFESNNQSNNVGHATIFMNGMPLDGRKGLSVFGGYYSANGGDADFLFLQNGGDQASVHGIYGAEVQRSNSTTFTTNNVRIVNNGTNQIVIDLQGNAFSSFNTYVQSAGRPDIGVTVAGTNNYLVTGIETNYFLPGVDAPTGDVGGFFSSTIPIGSAVSLANGVAKDVATVSLGPGAWTCNGSVSFNPAGTTTQAALVSYISTVANTLPLPPNAGGRTTLNNNFITGQANDIPTGPIRYTLATATTIRLGAFAAFGVSTMTAYGFLGCNRSR